MNKTFIKYTFIACISSASCSIPNIPEVRAKIVTCLLGNHGSMIELIGGESGACKDVARLLQTNRFWRGGIEKIAELRVLHNKNLEFESRAGQIVLKNQQIQSARAQVSNLLTNEGRLRAKYIDLAKFGGLYICLPLCLCSVASYGYGADSPLTEYLPTLPLIYIFSEYFGTQGTALLSMIYCVSLYGAMTKNIYIKYVPYIPFMAIYIKPLAMKARRKYMEFRFPEFNFHQD